MTEEVEAAPQTGSFALPPEGKLWVVERMMGAGYDGPAVKAALETGDWSAIPLDAKTMREFSCHGCGAKPWRSPQGRIMVGCWGTCAERDFADVKEVHREQRMREAVRQARSDSGGEPDNPLAGLMKRGTSVGEGLWG